MNKDYIESGILELYVFGRLSDAENTEVNEMAAKHADVKAEIEAIEKAVINLSYSVAPYLSAEVYERIRQQLIEKHAANKTEPKVIPVNTRSAITMYIGWAAAVLLLFGLGFQYYKYHELVQVTNRTQIQNNKYQQLIAGLEKQNTSTEKALAVIRDKDSKIITLEGQQAAPDAYAKVYINEHARQIHVDIDGLPKPPEGMVYQVWALKLNPLTPTSIGILSKENLTENKGILPVADFDGAEAFGITLEPAGGSETPTLSQLYTLGKV